MPQVTNYPGTVINEFDDSLVATPSVGSFAATMGRATKGIVNAKVLVNNEAQLINTFGPPVVAGSYPLVSAIDYGIYSALQCLNETGNLWYVRLTDGTEKYSGVILGGTSAYTSAVISAQETSAYINTEYTNGNTPSDIFDLRTVTGLGTSGLRFNSTGPGKYGNDYAVSVETSSANSSWKYAYDTDVNATNAKWKSIFKVSVFVKATTDDWSLVSASISGSPEEVFYVSTDYTMLDNNGNSMFIEDVINGKSKFVYVRSSLTTGALPEQATVVPLVGGADSTNLVSALDDTGTAWSFFNNKETSPVNVMVAAPKVKDSQTSNADIVAIGKVLGGRYDFITPLQIGSLSAYTESAITISDISITLDSSYYAKYVGWTLVYDSYNASRVYLPNCLFAAAVMLRTDRITNPWEAPAGVERGITPSGKQNIEITPAVGGRLYDINLNTVKYINGTGNVLWGQKTAQLKNTARNRINVRRALLYIEQNVEKILNNFLFRGNTVKERERATSMINSFMQGVLAGGGVQSYKVVCDASNNNTSSNTLIVDLYIQPTYTIEFIKLNTIISASAVSTSEV